MCCFFHNPRGLSIYRKTIKVDFRKKLHRHAEMNTFILNPTLYDGGGAYTVSMIEVLFFSIAVFVSCEICICLQQKLKMVKVKLINILYGP
jgi:hypothetical protein